MINVNVRRQKFVEFVDRYKAENNINSVNAIADALGVSRQSIYNWTSETGNRLPDTVSLCLISEKTGFCLDCIIGNIKERTHDLHTLCEMTDLSETAAALLFSENFDFVLEHFVIVQFLNTVLSSPTGLSLVSRLNDYLTYNTNPSCWTMIDHQDNATTKIPDTKEITIEHQDAASTRISDANDITQDGIKIDSNVILTTLLYDIRRNLDTIRDERIKAPIYSIDGKTASLDDIQKLRSEESIQTTKDPSLVSFVNRIPQ